MKVLLYTAGDKTDEMRLGKEVASLIPRKNLEVYRTMEELKQRLHKPTHNLLLALLFAATTMELTQMVSIKHLLWDVRIILILPDRGIQTAKEGHILRPRFLSYTDSDFSDVRAVIEKMLDNASIQVNSSVKQGKIYRLNSPHSGC